MQYLTFRLKGVEYAVDVNIVETVVEYSFTIAVPSPVEYMRGVMDLRGRVIPLIDLRRKFGLAASEDTSLSCVIVISVDDGKGGQLSVGALVDEVSEVVTFEDGSVEAARSDGVSLWERYVSGIVRLEGRMIVVIEVEGLFSAREIEALHAA
jgi:purine-binding chemotaxis protein CheW